MRKRQVGLGTCVFAALPGDHDGWPVGPALDDPCREVFAFREIEIEIEIEIECEAAWRPPDGSPLAVFGTNRNVLVATESPG